MKNLAKFSQKTAWLHQAAIILIALVALMLQSQPVLAAGTTLAPGDLVFTGRITDQLPDSFSFVTFVPLDPGTVIYFTDNGWTGTEFRSITAISGSGKESIAKLTINVAMAAGRVIRSDETSPDFTWDTSSAIPAGSKYSTLGLSHTGDQIAAVQSTNTANPLFSGFTALAQYDDTGAFEPATDNFTGALLPGLSPAAGTALLSSNLATYGAFNLNTLTSGTPSAWRTAIANESNWTFNPLNTATTPGTRLPTGTLALAAPASPASIITEPASQAIISGTVATLSVEAGGAAPLSYQWYQGNTGEVSNPLAGATAATFTTPLFTTVTPVNYWVRVTNSLGSVDSATITVVAIDPARLTEKSYLPAVSK